MYGQDLELSIAHQNSYGTAVTAANSFMPIPLVSESVGPEKPPIEIQNMRGVLDEGPIKEGPNAISGDIEMEAHPIALGQLLKAVLDTPTSTKANSASVWTHVFKPRTSDFDRFAAQRPLTVHKNFQDSTSQDLFYDMQGTTLALSIANGELLKATCGLLGGKYSQKAAISVTFPDVARAWSWDVASASIGGVAVNEINNATVTIDNALANKHTFSGDKEPSRTKRDGFRTTRVEGTMLFETRSHYLDFKAQTEQKMILNLSGAGSEISSGYNDELKIDVPTFRFEEFKPTASGPGQIEVGFTGRAIYNQGSGCAVAITLVNTKSAY